MTVSILAILFIFVFLLLYCTLGVVVLFVVGSHSLMVTLPPEGHSSYRVTFPVQNGWPLRVHLVWQNHDLCCYIVPCELFALSLVIVVLYSVLLYDSLREA